MASFDPDLVNQIRIACEHFDRTLAGDLALQLAAEIRGSDEPYPAALAHNALKPLRRKRYFDVALQLAEAVLESGQGDPLVRVQYAQALIDSGRIAAAIPYLESFIASTSPRSLARSEAQGLLGRAYKQLYVNGGGEPWLRIERLVRAFNAYYDAYAGNPALAWHGINAVALLHRAARDEIRLPPVPPFERRLFDEMCALVESGNATVWDRATAAEAAIALGDHEFAKREYAAYVASDDVDAFEIRSSLRQLEEVWQLTPEVSPGAEILPLLHAELLRREGGAVRLEPEEFERELQATQGARLEKTFGDDRVKSLVWYETGLQRSRPVCRIEQLDELPQGTGFVVDGGEFHRNLEGELLLLTNYHVLSYDHPRAIEPARAMARFQALNKSKTYRLDGDIVWSDRELDATLVRFARAMPRVKPFPIAEACPTREKEQDPPLPRVYVIGHPQGGPLSISLYDNELIATDGLRVHYRAPTEPGNSGSPVFDEDWQLIALHHAGDWGIPSLYDPDERYDANEGFWIGKIREACRRGKVAARKVSASPPRPRSARPSTPSKTASRRRT